MLGELTCELLEPFGMRIELDLSRRLDEARIAQLRKLFDVHHLLLLPGQSLSAADHRRVAGLFGPLAAEKAVSRYSTDPEMGALGAGELAFHSDLSCTPQPLLGISIYAIEVEDRSSETIFVNAMAAAPALPEAMRAQLAGLHVMNLWPLQLAERQRRHAAPKGWPGTAPLLLKPHPRTNAAILYLNASHTDSIVEMQNEEGEALIQLLFSRLYDPANRYVHRWRNGDFLVWDNLALQHARSAVPAGVVRTLQRVEIGSATYADLMPPQLHAAYAKRDKG